MGGLFEGWHDRYAARWAGPMSSRLATLSLRLEAAAGDNEAVREAAREVQEIARYMHFKGSDTPSSADREWNQDREWEQALALLIRWDNGT